MADREAVLVIDRSDLFSGDWPQGYRPLGHRDAQGILATVETRGRFELRERAEDEPRWKQCIPYCAITRQGEVLCVERRTTQGETRLHGRLSIGLGGHIGPEDGPLPGIVARGLSRELQEELHIDPALLARAELIGLLNDDSNPVGQVHFGLVHRLEIGPDQAAPKVREISKMQGSFRRLADPGEAWQDAARLESWSAALIPHLAPR